MVTYNFFALNDDSSNRIQKIRMKAEPQRALSLEFERQQELFDARTSVIPFDTTYKLDDNEIFQITDFEDYDELLDVRQNMESYEDFRLDTIGAVKIKALFAVSDDPDMPLLFHNFDKRQIIHSGNRWSFTFDKSVFDSWNGCIISFGTKIAATLQLGELRFVSFYMARRIFDLEAHFKEATDDQIQAFFGNSMFIGDIDKCLENSDTHWYRNKIAIIIADNTLDKFEAQDVYAVAKEMGINIALKDEKIVLPDDKTKLKKLLKFLSDDFLYSPLTETFYDTNSRRKLKDR